MEVDELLPGAWSFTPVQHGDDRGFLLEWYRDDVFTATTGRPLQVAQANHSRSRRGVIRAVHYQATPPGQGKYVYCPEGEVLDVAVDIRVGSPTFGSWRAVVLGGEARRAVYLSEGLGHGFVVLSEWASICYLVTTRYDPARELEVSPLDVKLAIDWRIPRDELILSARDTEAPTLDEAEAAGLLPRWDDVRPGARG